MWYDILVVSTTVLLFKKKIEKKGKDIFIHVA